MRFGSLTVISKADKPEGLKKKATYWLCKCNCGNESVVCASNLKNGHSTRCWECSHLIRLPYFLSKEEIEKELEIIF